MMEEAVSNDKETFVVHLSGGSPWGFTIHGGSEFNSKLYIKRLTPGGKASNSQELHVGDEVLCVNDKQCLTRAKAIEYVKNTGQTLQLTIKRSNNQAIVTNASPRHNNPKEKSTVSPLKSSSQEIHKNDFYSTYSVDPEVYSKIVQNTKDKKINSSHDSGLSASNEDLLDRYRTRGAGSEEEIDTVGFSNGRLSPTRDLSGTSFPEGQLHGRTLTSPGRIQKVKIISANISSSSSTYSSPDDEGSRHHSRISPVKHSPIARQYHQETESSPGSDNWFERWLRDDKTCSTTEKDVSVKDACSKFEQEARQQSEQENQHQQVPPKTHSNNKSNFSRSKSFSGRPSYGVVFGTTAVKSDDQRPEITAYQAPLPSTRYNSGDLLREKARKSVPGDARQVTTIQEEKYTERMSRKSLGAYPITSSTTSLDSFGDPRKQGPAIPPRRSDSKLLRSMRRGKTSQSSTGLATTREAQLREETTPKHSVSNSWPSDFLGNEPVPLSNTRQSWPPEETRAESDAASGRAAAKRSSSVVIKAVRTSSASSEPKIYRSSSMENQLDTGEAAKAHTIPRPQSAQMRRHPNPDTEMRYHKLSLQQQQPIQPKQPQQHRYSLQQERHVASTYLPQNQQQQYSERQQQPRDETTSSGRIEDTNILQKLMNDSQVLSSPQPVRQTVKSRIQRIEKCSSQPNLLEDAPNVSQLKPGTSHYKQRSWDNSFAAFNKTYSNARSELRATGRFGSTERLLDVGKNDPVNVEHPVSPVKVTSRQITQTPAAMESKDSKKLPEKPVSEQILRTESAIKVEKEVYLEEMFKNLQEKPPLNSNKDAISRKLRAQDGRNVTLSMGDDDVFTNQPLDDSLPPPPPPTYSYQESSYENLPLPTPPRELLGSPVCDIKQDKNRNEVYSTELKGRDNRRSYTENHFNMEDKIIEPFDNNAVVKKRPNSEENMNVKNANREGIIYQPKTENNQNYINTEYKPESLSKEASFNESKSPSKSERDSTETLVNKQSPSPIVMTSTPTRTDSDCDRASPDSDRGGISSPFSGSSLSTPSSSRPGSMMSPKLEQLDKEKCVLVDSMKNKIQALRSQMNEIADEISENEKLGEKVTVLVEGKATPSEFSKYQRFTGELNKIVLLLLSLTQRMHRYENTLQDLDMAEERDRQQRDILLDKIDHVKSQYEEACKIKEVNDKRGEVVSAFLENYFDEDEFADFQYYIDMKTQLALMHAEIKDKVKMGEERLNTLTATSIDWNMPSFCGY